MEYYAAERKKKPLPLVTAWIELENIMLSEISQEVKDKYHMISPISGIYCIFWTIRCTPQIWEENGGVSYSLNVAYLALWSWGGAGGSGAGFSPYFPPLKPRYVLWFDVSYSPKNTVTAFLLLLLRFSLYL